LPKFPHRSIPPQAEVDHYDSVFLHDADQRDDTYEGDQTEIVVEEHQHDQRPDTGGAPTES
jgi:hypothetical protein